MTDRNAQAGAFGWDFQSNLALYFASKDLKSLSRVKVEGPTEDIELFYEDGRSTFIQAKSQLEPYNSSNTNSHLKNALKTLIDATSKTDYSVLYYGSNISNPFVFKEFSGLFGVGATDYSFNELPPKIKAKIEKYVHEVSISENLSLDKFDYNRLRITTLPFFGDDDETRYRVIKQRVENLLDSLGLKSPQINSIFTHYQLLFTQNSSKKINIYKKDFAWPIIVYSLDTTSDEFYEEFNLDVSEEDAIESIYTGFIEKKTLEFTLFNEVSNHFLDFTESKSYQNKRNAAREFIDKHCLYYSRKIFYGKLDDMSEPVTQLILWRIIKKIKVIKRLNKEVGL